MTRSRPSSRSSVKRGLLLSLAAVLVAGCSFSVAPSCTKDDLATIVQEKIKQETGRDVATRLVGSTLCVYLPLENIVEVPRQPRWFWMRFNPVIARAELRDAHSFVLAYSIKAVVPEKKTQRSPILKKEAIKAITNAWLVLRRSVFSMDDRSQQEMKFYRVVTADVAGGTQIQQLAYAPDLVKMTFSMINVPEYQHRIVTRVASEAGVVGDREGAHAQCRDHTFREFLLMQIGNRVENRFNAENNAMDYSQIQGMSDEGIEKEAIRIVRETLAIYGDKEFSSFELRNASTGSTKTIDLTARRAPVRE